MHLFLTITQPNEETASDRQCMLLKLQEGSLNVTGLQVAQKVCLTSTFCLFLQALLTLPKPLLQLCEVELTY
jgi:hypothetical protein